MLLEQSSGQSVLIHAKLLHVLSVVIVLLTILVSALGLFYTHNGAPFDFINQYGDKLKIYGSGLYAHDSYFRAPIFRGTDFTMLFVACPLLIFSLVFDIKKNNLKTRLLLVSVLTCFVYYAASIAFGVTYNFLQLAYIFLFGASFFGLIEGIRSIPFSELDNGIGKPLPYKGIFVFMAFTGLALFAAWLPDILTSLSARRSLLRIEKLYNRDYLRAGYGHCCTNLFYLFWLC